VRSQTFAAGGTPWGIRQKWEEDGQRRVDEDVHDDIRTTALAGA